jgi:hypothetical protein
MIMKAVAAVSVLAISVLRGQAQTRDSEASEAQILDPTQECTAYNYAPVDALVRFQIAHDRSWERKLTQ